MVTRDSVPECLLSDVKNHLDITWDDVATDCKLGDLIAAGMAYLDDKLGAEGDYLAAGYSRTLLMEYVRYARDAALDVFESNYQSLLLGMQTRRLVGIYAQDTVSAGQ